MVSGHWPSQLPMTRVCAQACHSFFPPLAQAFHDALPGFFGQLIPWGVQAAVVWTAAVLQGFALAGRAPSGAGEASFARQRLLLGLLVLRADDAADSLGVHALGAQAAEFISPCRRAPYVGVAVGLLHQITPGES